MPEVMPSKERLLNAFVDQLIEDKGWGERDPEELLKLRLKLKTQADEAVEKGVLGALSDEQLDELGEMADRDAPDEEVSEFFKSLKINYVKVATDALSGFRQRVLNDEIEED